MKNSTIWFVGSAVALLAIVVVVVISRPVDPMQQPGISWSRGFLRGETIRLLHSGTYVHSAWCDICQEERSFGTWRPAATGYELRSSKGKVSLFRKISYRGCTVLLPPNAPSHPLPPDTFRRDGDKCAAGL